MAGHPALHHPRPVGEGLTCGPRVICPLYISNAVRRRHGRSSAFVQSAQRPSSSTASQQVQSAEAVLPSLQYSLQVRARTSRWGLGTSSARALRFDRVDKVFNRTADNPPDTDPVFDPEADAARIRAETAAKAQVVGVLCCRATCISNVRPMLRSMLRTPLQQFALSPSERACFDACRRAWRKRRPK